MSTVVITQPNFSVPDQSTSSAPAPTRSIAPTGFLHNKGAVAGTFTAVGVIVAVLAVLLLTTCIRRRRAKKFDDDVAAAAAAAYRDADGYWEREDNWTNAPSSTYPSSAHPSSSYTDGTHGAYNERPLPVSQSNSYQNYNDPGPNATGYGGGHPGANGYNTPGEAYGMNNLGGGGYHDPSYGAVGVGAGALAGGVYAAHHNRQKSPPPAHDPYQAYADTGMGMTDSIEGGRYPVPPARSRSMNQGRPAVGRSQSNSSSGHGNGSYGYPQQGAMGQNPFANRSGSASPPQGYSQGYGKSLPQMQEHHDEGDAYDGLTPESDHHGHVVGHEDEEFGDVEDHPRVLRVANE